MVFVCSSCGDEAGPAGAGGVELVTVGGDHSTEWDSMTAPVSVKDGCIAFGDAVAVFPEESRLAGAPPTSLTTPAGFEIPLDGSRQELLGDSHALNGPDAADLLDGSNLKRLEDCAADLKLTEFWVVLDMSEPA